MKRAGPGGGRPEHNTLEVMPLGAGQEVGRSCCHVTYKGKTVMVRGRRPLRPFPSPPALPARPPSPRSRGGPPAVPLGLTRPPPPRSSTAGCTRGTAG